jgi:hypothetical protein
MGFLNGLMDGSLDGFISFIIGFFDGFILGLGSRKTLGGVDMVQNLALKGPLPSKQHHDSRFVGVVVVDGVV